MDPKFRRKLAPPALVEVKSWQEAMEAMDGREYTLDGIHGTIRTRTLNERRWVFHEPSAVGRESDLYLKTKRELRDDWDTDLTHSERLPTIMVDLNIHFASEAA